MNETITDKEAFESLFQSFMRALSILSKPAKEQCEIMGYYNTAWELKDEVFDGSDLIDFPGEYLTDEKKYAIEQLLTELRKIPDSVLQEAITEDANLRAMNHPCWIPIRKHAVILLRSLE